jgi:hypothetical protein
MCLVEDQNSLASMTGMYIYTFMYVCIYSCLHFYVIHIYDHMNMYIFIWVWRMCLVEDQNSLASMTGIYTNKCIYLCATYIHLHMYTYIDIYLFQNMYIFIVYK